MNKIWLHCATKKNAQSIMKNGFKVPIFPKRFGTGIYFENSEEYGYGNDFINYRLECLINMEGVKEFNRDYLLKEYNISEDDFYNYGIPSIEEYAKKNNLDGIIVTCDGEGSELIIYNKSIIIKIEKMYESKQGRKFK